MDLSGFIEEQKAANLKLAAGGQRMPPPGAVPIDLIRRNRREGKGGFPRPVLVDQARTVAIETTLGRQNVRIFPCEGAAATYVYVHGGGWTFGSIDEQDARLADLGAAAGVDVVAVEYRLAPEHPYPAAIDDVEASLLALAKGSYCRSVMLLGGESAGAHLALAALLRLRRNAAEFRRIAGLNLCYGIYDLSMTPSQRNWGDAPLILSTPVIRWLEDQFLGGMPPEARRHPDVSPLYADLGGLPPALLTVGDRDLLLDDTLFLASRLKAAGNAIHLQVFPEAPHGFNALPTAMARAGNSIMADFLRTRARSAVGTAP